MIFRTGVRFPSAPPEIRLLVNLYWLRGVFVSCNDTYNQMVILLKPRILTHTCTFWFYPVRKTRDHVFALVTQGISHAKFTLFLRIHYVFSKLLHIF